MVSNHERGLPDQGLRDTITPGIPCFLLHHKQPG